MIGLFSKAKYLLLEIPFFRLKDYKGVELS